MKPIILAIVAFAVCSLAVAQGKDDEDLKRKQAKDVKSSSAPVSHAEAQAVFNKAWKALATGLKSKASNPVKMASDKNPVTKNEILAAFKAIVEQTKPMFKRSATKVTFDSNRLRKDFDKAAFGKLIEQGFVMPVGPLVVGKNGPVSTYEFGDAVGVLLIKIADLAHMPSRKFTPDLMGDGS